MINKMQSGLGVDGGTTPVRYFGGDLKRSSFVLLSLQLALVLLVMQQYRIEEASGLLRIAPLILLGFLVHAWLPRIYRLPFFLLLTLVAIVLNFGFVHGIMLIGLGVGLIGLCHLPVPFYVRVGLLLVVGVGLASIRAEWIQTRWTALPTLVLPVLGAMFMFRLAIYLYELRHEKQPATLWERLAYFFMLPNLFFLLFPVIDYQTFRRTYYDQSAQDIYQKGILWVFRGVTHLLLYRFIYHHLVLAPAEVVNLGGVIQYMLTTYLLYLRISGQFHLIIGILCLFGFNLPETHHLYFLASSFTDYWRRINIYWKDFMMKMVYYPVFMRVRRLGMFWGIGLATVVVFFGTWLLHSYQWFWLRGAFPVTATDGLFWGILGLLVVINALREARRGRKRTLGTKAWSFRGALQYTVQVVGMFVFIMVLWTLWSSTSVREFVTLLKVGIRGDLQSWILLGGGLLGIVFLGVLIQYLGSRGWILSLAGGQPSSRWAMVLTFAGTLGLLGMSQLRQQGWLPGQIAPLMASLSEERLNQRDEALMERGYYEGLLNTDKYTSTLWKVAWKPKEWGMALEPLFTRQTNDMAVKELVPLSDVIFNRARLRTNRWGMRDKDYEQAKPPQTYRIAVLGASHAMGSGVADEEVFEAILEERLNREHAGGVYERYEVLNFSVTAYSLVPIVYVHDQKVTSFRPDAIFYVLHPGEIERTLTKLNSIIRHNFPIPYPGLRQIIEQAGVHGEMTEVEIQRRLRPYGEEVIRWGYGQLATAARAYGARPVWILLPMPEAMPGEAEEAAYLEKLAHEAGFVTIKLEGVYKGEEVSSIIVAPWDWHPNAKGHALVADRLYQELLKQNIALELGLKSLEKDVSVDRIATEN
ncbi:hypothetical protein GQ464_004250 [Rhodocaloribacter litoris]|uniref:hypothetical protein n=1 Tax=Rhodocaloribacter litoris TaxID=2558931 RepID=UPI0014213057|nr:hypothetical protein [Rhodocaloribacter litoris]QXD16171.1 hypothetical protein GQ464_004250 [Rhodocaloribacter litoris]